MSQRARTMCFRSAAAIAVAALAWSLDATPQAAPPGAQIPQALRERAQRDGRVRVIVELDLSRPHVAEGLLPDEVSRIGQRQAIASAATRVLSRLPGPSYRLVRRYQSVPFVALEVDADALAALENAADVVRVMEDAIVRPVLAESAPLVEADQAWSAGYDGAGTTIAVLDTGVDSAHPFLAGKVVEEACYSSKVPGTSDTFCPNGHEEQVGPGSAAPCPLADCFHGTHVAGIAAGNGDDMVGFSGVARRAQLMAVQVFAKITSMKGCGGLPPCVGGFTSDVIAGLERVYAVAPQRNIVAVNMSLGAGAFSNVCDQEPYKPIIDNLRSIGVASIVASGNSGYTSQIGSPACISSAVSVGSTTKDDVVSWFSNTASFLTLFAPGEDINSSVPGGGFAVVSGTSMAAPHVAGTWSLLKQAAPGRTVSELVAALRQTGTPISDGRFSGTVTVPRVRTLRALATLVPVTNPAPTLTAIAPARVVGGGESLSLTVTGSSFNTFSVVQWNGAARPTTVLNTTTLVATISTADLAVPGSVAVSVFTPSPGGGTSAALTFTVDPPPTLSVSATTVGPGSVVTATLANAPGGASDWLALAPVGSGNSSYVQWTNVGGGVTARTWTVTMPSTGGAYEFRLMVNYARAAVSPPVTVDPTLNPIPGLTSISPASAIAGSAPLTLTVTGTGFIPSSVVRWNGANRSTVFTSATQLQATIDSADLAATGTAQITVFTPAPGGGTSLPLWFGVNPPPSLSVGSTSVEAGSTNTVTLANGAGGQTDWIALAATSAPNSSYVWYAYVGQGVTSQTWNVTMPATAGTYEFRLFLSGGYTRAATSPAITVLPGPNPVPALSSLSPSAIAVGSGSFTLAVTGSGFVASSVVRWNGSDRATTFVSATQVNASIPASDLTVATTAQVTVFNPSPGGGTSAPRAFTVGGTPTLSVSASTVTGGSPLTVTLTNGFGGSGDWLAFAATTDSNVIYQQYTYVGAGVTTRTWTVTAPLAGGTYEFRLFVNYGYTRVATSPPVTVLPGTSPVPALSSLSPASAPAGGAAFTLTVNGTGFVSTSTVRWNGADRATTFVSSTQLRASIPATDLAAVGTAQVTVFTPAPGGGVSGALAFSIGAAPTLTVSATNVAPGASVTMTLTGGYGGSTDWLALARAADSALSYLQYTYVGTGVTTRTWTVTMPATPGVYEFRLFLNSSFTIAARSPAVTVQ